MQITNYEVHRLRIPFKTAFIHAKKTRKETDNLIVKLYSEKNVGMGECIPRDYVTGENVEKALKRLNEEIIPHFKKMKITSFHKGIDAVTNYLKHIQKDSLSSFSGFETAYINLLCKEFGKGIKDILDYLDIKYNEKTELKYSAILGIGVKSFFKAFFARRFDNVKIKVSPQNLKTIPLLKRIIRKDTRLDANFGFDKKNISSLIKVATVCEIDKIEQPVKDKDIMFVKPLFDKKQIKIILDESVCSKKELDHYKDDDYIFNLRITKNGGIINTLLFYKTLKKSNKQIILGSLVGETVLSRYHIVLAKYLDLLYIEGDYNKFLFKKEIINNPSFDSKGILSHTLDLGDDIQWKA